MSQRPRIQVTQAQRLQLTTRLQASIRVLRADAAGLACYLEEQAAENPN
ncbi:MAG: RNA polymerase sigma-54 factor, partial [Alphaproteobacteria bacterium]